VLYLHSFCKISAYLGQGEITLKFWGKIVIQIKKCDRLRSFLFNIQCFYNKLTLILFIWFNILWIYCYSIFFYFKAKNLKVNKYLSPFFDNDVLQKIWCNIIYCKNEIRYFYCSFLFCFVESTHLHILTNFFSNHDKWYSQNVTAATDEYLYRILGTQKISNKCWLFIQ
jgi:hypothetical protein